MRFRGGFGRAFAPFSALALALALSGCLGQDPEPQEYELGGPAGATPAVAAAASAKDPSAKDASAEDFAAEAGDVVYFNGDSAELSADARAILRKQISWLNRHPDYRVTIEGHAHEWGTLQHNLSLGAQRAVAVKTYLQRNGLRAHGVHTISYGKERLVADCTALTCRAKNRRAQTVISPPPSVRSAQISR